MKPALKYPLLLWTFLLIVWSLYRYYFRFPEMVDEFLVKPILWIGLVLLAVKFIENRSLSTIGWTKEHFFENIYLGWSMGAIFAVTGFIANALKYNGFLPVAVGMGSFSLLKLILVSFATGFCEETVFRGYILTRLEKSIHFPLAANAVSALLFALLHVPIAIFIAKVDISTLLIYEFTLFLVGIGNGIVFNQRKSIVAPTIAHAFWNLTITLFR